MSDTVSENLYAADAPQRMALLTGIPTLLGEFGVALDDVIAGLPFGSDIFLDEERRVPYWVATELLRRSARLTGCETFGIRLGARYDHRCLGAPGRWMQTAPDLQTALSGFVELQHANSRGASVYLHRYGDAVLFGYGVYERRAVAHEQIYGMIEALAFNVIRTLTRGAARPLEVLFSFRRPRDARAYTDLFGVPIRFDQPESGLVLSLSALGTPIAGEQDEGVHRLRRLAGEGAPAASRRWTDRVSHVLRPLLLRGEPTSAAAARHLSVNVRTLARRLAEEGTGFQAILDNVRYATARELLAVTDMPIGDIAHALCYAAHGPFIDAFRRWSGVTPSKWRRAIYQP